MKNIILLILFQENNNDNKNNLNFILKLIIFLKVINLCFSSCSKNQPFIKGGNCIEECSFEELNKKQCEISNEIIKGQWLNNIIYLGESSCSYINIETSENNDLFAEVSSFPESNIRYFYGLTKEGKGFFKDNNNKDIEFYMMEIDDVNVTGRFESEIFSFKLDSNLDSKIYLLSYSKSEQFIEIYDFYQNKSYFNLIYETFGSLASVHQISAPHFKMNNSNENIYFLGLLAYDYSVGKNFFYLRSVKFHNLDIKENSPDIHKQDQIECSPSLMVSCFDTVSKYIVCFIKDINNKYVIIVYNEELVFKQSINLNIINTDNYAFYKCIHFFGEIGVFAYYQDHSVSFVFKEYDPIHNEIKPFTFTTDVKFVGSQLQENIAFNDMIKIVDKKFYFVAVSQDKNSLFIILINNYCDKAYSQRVYKLNTYVLYKYKFYDSIRVTIYKNFLCLGSNFYLGQEEVIHTSIMIFSYPNSTNTSIKISDHLLLDNAKIDNIALTLNGSCFLENNVFGLIYAGIQFIENANDNDDIYLSTLSNDKIIKNRLIKVNEKVKIFMPKNDNNDYEPFIYQFKYACAVTEPSYEEFNNYADNTNGNSETEYNYFQNHKTNYIGKYSFFDIILENTLTENCNIKYCKLCYKNSPNECFSCEYEYNIIDNYKQCYNIYSDLLQHTYYTNDMNMTQIEQINSFFRNELINRNYSGDNIIIQTGNVAFQLSTLEYQKNQNNKNLSNIDLGDCEIRLINSNNLQNSDTLIIFKNDIKILNKTATYVYYEVYDSKDYKQLDLGVCKDTLIDIYSPLFLDDETLALLSEFNNSDYNIFNANDSFYNDICTKYTSENGTDMLLSDRKKDIYNKTSNKLLCQDGCELVSYNIETGKAKCNCAVKVNEVLPDLINMIGSNKKEIMDSFFDPLSNSNFRLLKCYKNAFDFSNFFQNIGRIIMSLILLGLIANCIIYIVKDRNKLNIYSQFFLKNKTGIKTSKKDDKKKKKPFLNKKKSKVHCPEKKRNKKLLYTSTFNKKKPKSKIQNTDYDKNANSSLSRMKILNKQNKSNLSSLGNKDNNNDLNIYKKGKRSLSFKGKNNKNNKNNINNINNKKKNKNKNQIKYEEQELNDLDYKIAIAMDKRTYFEYYWCLLKKKQLILFTFLPVKDYNLLSLKISLFLFSFSLYFAINAFFFNDDTMHRIYIENGQFNFIYQLPVTIYSTLVSAFVNMLLRTLAITEKNFLSMKKENDLKIFMTNTRNVLKAMKTKIVMFFIVSFLLMFFLWYFISCFCSIYHNTQLILIEDTLITFGLSMLYPFGLNLLPGLFRIPALRASKKDKEILYNLSKIIAIV